MSLTYCISFGANDDEFSLNSNVLDETSSLSHGELSEHLRVLGLDSTTEIAEPIHRDLGSMKAALDALKRAKWKPPDHFAS